MDVRGGSSRSDSNDGGDPPINRQSTGDGASKIARGGDDGSTAVATAGCGAPSEEAGGQEALAPDPEAEEDSSVEAICRVDSAGSRFCLFPLDYPDLWSM